MLKNKRQRAAATRLRKALDACHEAGLKGGVFSSSFCLWPIKTTPEQDPFNAGIYFFRVVDEIGESLDSKMSLDGGAGS